MIHPPVPPARWAAEGARVAPALEEVSAALVIGRDAAAAALVAIGLARSQPLDRRTAIGDLAQGAGPLRVDGAPGLLECIQDGLPVSEVARPLGDDDRVFLLPSGPPSTDHALLFASPRWPRLIAGFREVDALLLLVATADAPGLAALIAEVDGVVAVDLPAAATRGWPLLATVDRPADELPPIRSRVPTPALGTRRPGRWRRAVLGATAGVVLVAGMTGLGLSMRGPRATASVPDAPNTPHAGPALTPDTLTLGAIVNPAESAIASLFTIELVAANTPAGANSQLAMRGLRLPAPTLAPVLLGSDERPWYRALTGAWRDRADAEAFLGSLRDRGLVRPNVGRVLRAPYALLLASGIRTSEVPAALAWWAERGISAYALLQEDGRARLYVGAFETSDQSVLLASSLRDLGVAPRVAFRTGRTF